ncbi:ABC transporter ATP-binding protein [Nonomuraea guangzhouensis]|uniref:Spermidine/putrescine import ATP-binding protein PotA n=1 Tax=Nonomuraea guangzhouensis TaxID=1291555 RepID=A0ABW4GC39_9ACTN|nr:ABC transporter ATP-binding protein [Nonomuraea guangzhouensis]
MTDRRGAAIRLSSVTKRYAEHQPPVVNDVCLEIAAGEFITLLGPSGSGKSTTLNMIAGFEQLTAGDILIDGVSVASLPPYKRGLGMVFQHYALFPHMTIAQNVAFPLQQRKMRKRDIQRRVDDVLDLVGLAHLRDRLPGQISGGQAQRVALARAVVFEPHVLLMDEPLGALDKKLREQLQGEIARMHRELGITFVFVTHDQEEALALSDRIAVFEGGRIEQVGTAQELYAHPASLFAAEFLGESNVFHGLITERRGRVSLVGEGFEVLTDDGSPGLVGTAGVVVVRPERIRLTVGDVAVEHDVNAMTATVTHIVYQGSYRKVAFRTDAGTTGSAREPAGAESSAMPGDRVTLSWRVGDGVIVPARSVPVVGLPGDALVESTS